MNKNDTIPAEADKPCDCCGRIHRKLHHTDGLWMGKTCTENYKLFRSWKNVTDLVWRGYEKQYYRVAKLHRGG